MSWPLMQNTITFYDKLKLIYFILKSHRFTNGQKVREFEKAWSKWIGCRYSLFVSSGSSANLILISAIKELYKLPNGSRVLVPANTWVTNVSPIIQLGLEPVFMDISLDHFSFDTSKLKPDPSIRVVFVTHLLGLNAPVETLKTIYPDAIFIEDVCESHGVTDNLGHRRGSKSVASTFSFYYGHHITTIEGGMVCTNDQELYELLRMKRSHGLAREMSKERFDNIKDMYSDIDSMFLFLTDGFNVRNTEIAAVIGLTQLPKLDKFIEIRKRNYKQFCDRLKSLEDYFYVPSTSETNSSFVFPFIGRTKDTRNRLLKIFDSSFIEYRPVVAGNLLRQPFLKNVLCAEMTNADIVHNHGVYIGNNQCVTKQQINKLFDLIEHEFKT